MADQLVAPLVASLVDLMAASSADLKAGYLVDPKVGHLAEWKVEQWVGDSGILLVGRLAVDSVVQMVEKMVLKLVGCWAVLRVKWWG